MTIYPTIVHCPTKEDWEKVAKKAIEDGSEWGDGTKDIHFDLWDEYESTSCIRIEKSEMGYCRKGFYEEDRVYKNTSIITAKQYLNLLPQKR